MRSSPFTRVARVVLAVLLVLLIARVPGEAVADESPGLRVVGQIGGPAMAVAVAPGRVYAAMGPRLASFDVTDPTHPTLTGQSAPLDGVPTRLVLGGSTVYALLGQSVAVVDGSAPADPHIVASIAVVATDGVVVGDRLYLVGAALTVVDVATPAQPRVLGQTASLGGSHVAVVGSTAYVHTGLAVRTGDVSDPSTPTLLGESRLNNPYAREGAVGIAVSGSFVYGVDNSFTVSVIDVADPAQPTLVSLKALSEFIVADVQFVGQYAYVAKRFLGLYVYDLSDPSRPVELGHYATRGATIDSRILGGYAYAADYTSGLTVISVSDARAPRQVGAYAPQLAAAGPVVVASNLAYVVTNAYSGSKSGLSVLDVSNPAAPRYLAFHSIDDLEDPTDIVVVGTRAYLPMFVYNSGPDRLRIVDIADPTKPRNLGYVDLNTLHYWSHVAVSGTYAYVVTLDHFLIVDVSDPAAPRVMASVPTVGRPRALVAAPPYVYVAEAYTLGSDLAYRGGGLRVFDVSTPTAPRDVAFVALSSDRAAEALAFVDPRTLLVADAALYAVDVTDPIHPRVMGRYDRRVAGIATDGRFALVGTFRGGTDLLSVPPGGCPVQAGHVTLPEASGGLALSGGYGFIGGGSAGLVVVRAAGMAASSCRTNLPILGQGATDVARRMR